MICVFHNAKGAIVNDKYVQLNEDFSHGQAQLEAVKQGDRVESARILYYNRDLYILGVRRAIVRMAEDGEPSPEAPRVYPKDLAIEFERLVLYSDLVETIAATLNKLASSLREYSQQPVGSLV